MGGADELAGEEPPMRLPIQRVDPELGGCSGVVASGCIRVGDEIFVAPSAGQTRVARIITKDGDSDAARTTDEATIVFADKTVVSPGDILCHPSRRPQVADQFAARLVWMSHEPLLPGRSYLLKINGRTTPATITKIKYRLDAALAEIAARTLSLNDIGFCNLAVATPVVFDPYERNRVTGAFALIDRRTEATAATGMISFALRRATNIHLQQLSVDKAARAAIKRQKPAILWFTGLSGAGKSTIANLVETLLVQRGVHTILLDGDNVRRGLNKDLGFSEADRVENIRRIGEVAKLMVEAGLIVLCAFISPFSAERRFVRGLVGDGEFVEIFLDTPLEVCIARDPKGLYKKALAGNIKNFTGIDQAYESPERPELRFAPATQSPSEIADHILRYLAENSVVAQM